MGEKPAILGEPPLGANAKPPSGWLRRWVPRAWSADQVVGRPSHGANRPQPQGAGLSWASSCLITGACLVLTGFEVVLGLHFVHLRFNQRSDIFCDFMLGQSVLATCILAQKHILYVLEGEVSFRDFIG